MSDKIIFYDIETDSKWASYANLHMLGYQIGMDSTPQLVNLSSKSERKTFKDIVGSPEWTKVGYNNINFDDIVLGRFGFTVCPVNRHDAFLMVKTCSPQLPAYGLKFVNWYYFGDPHEPERRLHAWCSHNGKSIYQAPVEILEQYCLYDVTQTVRLFRMYYPIVRKEEYH